MKIRKSWMRAAALLAAFSLICTSLAGCKQEPGETISVATETVAAEALQAFEFPDFDPVWGTTAYPGEYSKGYDVVIDYAYSDRYFDFASTLYNPSLATMSLCMQLSAWSSYEVDAWPEKSRNVQKLFEEIGFTGYAQNEFWGDQPSLHSIGVVAAHKDFEDYTLIALPVRGGNYYNEWGNNVALGLEGYHTGFANARDNVIAFLENYITDCDITGRVKLWVTGYSRGGAVANLVSGYLNQNALPNGAELAFEDLYCYTFEAPQGAMVNAVGSDLNHANIHNIVNANDIVTMVGPVDWGFSRYNTTTRLIPTVTTAQFESARDTMLEEFAEVLAGAPVITKPDGTAYRVSEYAKTLQVDFDPMNLLDADAPVLEVKVVDDTRQTMNEMLTRFVSCLVESLGGRDVFYDSLQSDLILLVELLKGYETGFDMDEVLDTVLTAMTENNYEDLKYVLSPVFAMNGADVEERIDQVVARLHEVLPQPEGFSDLYGTAGTLIQAIGKMLVNYPEEVLDVALAFTNSNVMQAHHQELTLAWVRAGDPHYTDTPWTMAVPEVLRSIKVNSPDGTPVNVEVYDSTGTLAASLHGDVVYRISEAIGCARTEDGQIVLHLPADEEYRILTDVAADGTVNIILSEYNVARSQVTRMQNYAGVSVKAGDTLTLEVPNLVEEEFTDEAQQGSTAEYRLLSGGEEVPSQELRGEEIDDTPVPRTYEELTEEEEPAVEETPVEAPPTQAPPAQEPPAEDPPAESTPVQVNICPGCQVGLPYGVNHVTACGVSGHYTCDGSDHVGLDCGHFACGGGNHWKLDCGHYVCASGDHTAASCGISGHYHCSGTHTAGACGTPGHYVCDGGDHQSLACGHYACESGDHSQYGDAYGSCGHYKCDSNVADLNHTRLPAGCEHFYCGGTENAMDHSYCSDCGRSKCFELPKGFTHGGTGAGSCYQWANYTCHGPCGQVLSDGGAHYMPCGHYSCDTSVAGLNHSVMACQIHYYCDSDEAAEVEHISCEHCGRGICDDGDHTAILACGCYLCERFYVNEPHDIAACETPGHYVCDDGDHTTVLDCGHRTCAEGPHVLRACNLHYTCDPNVSAETCVNVCSACKQPMCNGTDHTLAACGKHHASEGGDHTLATCNTHYVCEGGDHSAANGDDQCKTSGHYLCDGKTHTLCKSCSVGPPYKGQYECSSSIHPDNCLIVAG